MSFSQFTCRSETPGPRKRVVLFASLVGLALFIAISAVGAYALLPMLKGNANKLANAPTSPTSCHDSDSSGIPLESSSSTFLGGWNPPPNWSSTQPNSNGSSTQTDGVVQVPISDGGGTIYMTLYYCQQWNSVFGRFRYIAPTTGSTVSGDCYVDNGKDNSKTKQQGSGCFQSLASVPYEDTMVVEDTTSGSGGWEACWEFDPTTTSCTNKYPVKTGSTTTGSISVGLAAGNSMPSTDLVVDCPNNPTSQNNTVGLQDKSGGFICFGTQGFMNFSGFTDANNTPTNLEAQLPKSADFTGNGDITVAADNITIIVPTQNISPNPQWGSCIYTLGSDGKTVTAAFIPEGFSTNLVPATELASQGQGISIANGKVNVVGIALDSTGSITSAQSCPTFLI